MSLRQSALMIGAMTLALAVRPDAEADVNDTNQRALLVSRNAHEMDLRKPEKRETCELPSGLKKQGATCMEGEEISKGGTCTVECLNEEKWYKFSKNTAQYAEVVCQPSRYRGILELYPRPVCTVASSGSAVIISIIVGVVLVGACLVCCCCRFAAMGEKSRIDRLREAYHQDIAEQQKNGAGSWHDATGQYQGDAWGTQGDAWSSAPAPAYGISSWDTGTSSGYGAAAPGSGYGTMAPGSYPGGQGTSPPMPYGGYGSSPPVPYGGDWGQMR